MEDTTTYPTCNGIPIPLAEIYLPESELNVNKRKNVSNHHNCWPARAFGQCILLKTLRNLESQQTKLPSDVHAYLHNTYEPPELPTPLQALTEIERAAKAGEELSFRYKCTRMRQKIGEKIMKRVIENYDELKLKNRW